MANKLPEPTLIDALDLTGHLPPLVSLLELVEALERPQRCRRADVRLAARRARVRLLESSNGLG